MTPIDAASAEAANTQGLLAQALGQMQLQHWDQAMRLLESAIATAPPEMKAPAVEILAAIYVARNEHSLLRSLMQGAEPYTPQMTKGALLLARNHALGMDGSLPAYCNEETLSQALRAHVVTGAYQPKDLPVIVALLAQLGWAGLAGQIARLCADARVEIEAGILERVFAVLMAAGARADALELLEALKTLRGSAERPIRRWARLLGSVHKGPQTAGTASHDKVERFLQFTQNTEPGPNRSATKEPAPC